MAWISGEVYAHTYIRARLRVEVTGQGSNYHDLTAYAEYRRTNTYSGVTSGYPSMDISINGDDATIFSNQYREIPGNNNNWIVFGQRTVRVYHTSAVTVRCHFGCWQNAGWGANYFTNNGAGVSADVDCGLGALITEIGASLSNVVSRSNDVHATIRWTDQSGAQVHIACEEVDDSGNFKSLIHQWNNQAGRSGTTYSLSAAERLTYDGKNR